MLYEPQKFAFHLKIHDIDTVQITCQTKKQKFGKAVDPECGEKIFSGEVENPTGAEQGRRTIQETPSISIERWKMWKRQLY